MASPAALLLLSCACAMAADLRLADFPPRVVKNFRSYSDVTLLHVKVPERAISATWNLTAWEVKQSIVSLSSCQPRPLTVYVKQGSYPVISPDGSPFPAGFLERDPSAMWNISLASDATPHQLTVSLPAPGDWFAAVFADYTDPDLDGIGQSGLTLVCAALMQADVRVSLADAMHLVAEQQPITAHLDKATPTAQFKLFVPRGVAWARLRLDTPTKDTPLSARGRVSLALSRPSREAASEAAAERRDCGQEGCELAFAPSEDTWYFVTAAVDPADGGAADVRLAVTLERHGNVSSPRAEVVQVPLTRYSYGALFSFGFDRAAPLPSLGNQTLPTNASTPAHSTHSVLLRPGTGTAMQFRVESVHDVGGTLAVGIKMALDSLPSDVATKYVVKVTACLAHERQLLPTFSACGATPPTLAANSSSEIATSAHVQVAFPEAGTWHLTLATFCSVALAEVPCEAGLAAVNVSFLVESATCEVAQCGRYGQCYTAVSGALVYSACNCFLGYRGWACTDASQVTSDSALLAEVLLLTLSNLFFVPAIVVAIRWAYYTEALVYACAMLFSTFYHACDAGGEVFSFCLLRGNVLQFCDFFAAVLSVWVTLIAMAGLPPAPRSLAHMAGAVGIALGAEVNRTALWMFLAPTLIGLGVVSLAWGLRMRRRRECYPSGRYWKLHLPVGLALILVGLVAYAFLETARNYKYVHSVWHAVMALSIVVVLPSNRRDRAAVIPAAVDDVASDDAKAHGGMAALWANKCRAAGCCRGNDDV